MTGFNIRLSFNVVWMIGYTKLHYSVLSRRQHSDITQCLCNSFTGYCHRLPEENDRWGNEDRLAMILRLLKVSSFNGKMNALNEVNKVGHLLYTSPAAHLTCCTLHLLHTSPVTHLTCCTSHLLHISPAAHFTCYTLHLSHTSPVTHLTCHTPQLSHTSPVTHLTCYTLHLLHISPAAHFTCHTPHLSHTSPVTHLTCHTPHLSHTSPVTHTSAAAHLMSHIPCLELLPRAEHSHIHNICILQIYFINS